MQIKHGTDGGKERWWWWGTLIPSTALWMTVVCASYRATGEEGVEKHEEKKEQERERDSVWEDGCL